MMTWEKSPKMKDRDRDRDRESESTFFFFENMTNSTGNVTGPMASCQTDILTDVRLHYPLSVCVCVCGVTRLSDF